MLFLENLAQVNAVALVPHSIKSWSYIQSTSTIHVVSIIYVDYIWMCLYISTIAVACLKLNFNQKPNISYIIQHFHLKILRLDFAVRVCCG